MYRTEAVQFVIPSSYTMQKYVVALINACQEKAYGLLHASRTCSEFTIGKNNGYGIRLRGA